MPATLRWRGETFRVVGTWLVRVTAPAALLRVLAANITWPDYLPDPEMFLVSEIQRLLPDVEVVEAPEPDELPPDAIP